LDQIDIRRVASCAAVSVLLGLTAGLGLFLVGNNLPGVQGSLGATAEEAGWLTTAYFSTAMTAPVILTKVRFELGHRRFCALALSLVLAATAAHFLVRDWHTALLVRAALGFAQGSLIALAVLYMIDCMPGPLKVVGAVFGFATTQIGSPLARVIDERLLDLGKWSSFLAVDTALACLSLAAIMVVPLTPLPVLKRISIGDVMAFALYASAAALFAVVITQGRVRWWTDTDWLGILLALAIVLFGAYIVFDLMRKEPLVDLRWLAQPFMLQFMAEILLFRLVLSEQNVGIVGLMTAVGINNDQMHSLFAFCAIAVYAGFAVAIVAALRKSDRWLGVLSLALVVVAALMDSSATNLTRPEQLYFSQVLLAFAIAIFFARSALVGLGRTLSEPGFPHLVTYIACFALTQNLGSLLGSAWIGTKIADFQTENFHRLAEQLHGAAPLVAARLDESGLAALAQAATLESFVLAYDRLFQMIAAIAAAMLVWVSWNAVKHRELI
jgi:MFS family permease